MADVFFSHDHDDRAQIEPFVRLLEQAGLTVWWDSALLAGDAYRSVIDHELKRAGCIVVAWSSKSVASQWVCDEATEGLHRGVLVPFSLDGTRPPVGFGQIQTPDLAAWTGNAQDARARQLIGGAQRAVHGKVDLGPASTAFPTTPQRRRRGLLAGCAALAIVIVIGLVLATSRLQRYTTGSIRLPDNATSMTIAPDGVRGYVVHSTTGTISVLDLRSEKIIDTIDDIGVGALALGVTPDGRTGYISHYTSTRVSVVDLLTGDVTATVDVGAPQWDVHVTADGSRVYVADRGTGMLSVIDTTTNALITSVSTADDPNDSPTAVALAPDGRRAYATNRGSGTVAVIDTERFVRLTTIAVQRGPNEIAVSPDGQHAYVTNEGSDTVSVVDLIRNVVGAPIPVGSAPITVALTPEGERALVVNRGSATVSVIDTETGGVTATVTLGRDPGSVTVAPDGGTAYVTAGEADMVFTIAL